MSDVKEVVSAIREQCIKDGVEVVEVRDIPYGNQIKLRFGGQAGQINVYTGKKGLSVVVQAKEDFGQQLNSIKDRALGISTDKQMTPQATNELSRLPEVFDEPWIGIDESGKGDFFGPLVCVGVVVNPKDVALLQKLGVADSKTLSETKIRSIAQDLRILLKDRIKQLVLKPTTYNELYAKFGDESKNLNSMLAWAHSAVLKDLLQHHDVKISVSDKFANEMYILERTRSIQKDFQLIQETKAERNIAVAAASILARSALDKWFIEAGQHYNMSFPKGASQHVIQTGRDFVDKFGFDKLSNIAKLHFKTLEYVRPTDL